MKNSARQYGHNQGEAFMLMTYACDHCGHLETIWNSRDGVTPFCIECPSCGQMKCQHVDWQRDTYAPDHKPHRGQRFWRDGTPDEAEAIMRRRIASISDEHPVDKDREAELIRYARDGEGEFRKGWPMLDRAPEAIAAALVRDSRDALIERMVKATAHLNPEVEIVALHNPELGDVTDCSMTVADFRALAAKEQQP